MNAASSFSVCASEYFEIDSISVSTKTPTQEILDFLASKVLGIRTEVPSPPSTVCVSNQIPDEVL